MERILFSFTRTGKLQNIFSLLQCCGSQRSLFANKLVKKSYSTHTNYGFIVTDKAIQNLLNNVCCKVNSYPEGKTNGINNNRLIKLFQDREIIRDNIHSLGEIVSEKSGDEELRLQVEDEKRMYNEQLLGVEYELIEALSPKQRDDSYDGIILEITAGVGGQEAMLFAKDLYEMYCGYLEHKGWDFYTSGIDGSELGGVRHASMLVNSDDSYKYLQYESGVHRVQRVPATEKSGRIHTSTVTVAILPQPHEVDVKINDKDLIIETKRASGAGGQHVNTTDSAVRITHVPTGIITECQTERSQIRNKEIALLRLRAKIYQCSLDQQNSEIRSLRKLQVGSGARSEKVRTYNFNQDRITDHRLGKSFHNLPEFLKGGQTLDSVVKSLAFKFEQEVLNSFISDIRKQEN